MPTNLPTIRRQALELPPGDRQALIHELVASLDAPTLTEVDEAWFDLAQDRLEEIRKGKETIPGDQFFADIRRERRW